MKNTSLLLIPSTLFIASCASNYTISTNIDPNNIKHYFGPTQVMIYQDESEFTHRYHYIGMVEGESCQAKQHHNAPDKITARTNARRKAYQLQANAIVFTGCSDAIKDSGDKQCHASVICYGKAYQVESNQ